MFEAAKTKHEDQSGYHKDLTPKTRAPWEGDMNFNSEVVADAEMKAFVEEMNENWNERRKGLKKEKVKEENVKFTFFDLRALDRNNIYCYCCFVLISFHSRILFNLRVLQSDYSNHFVFIHLSYPL
ncbi:hypothetical protein MtrunA17_Chr1g0204311 [Medicago truncatula]|uniref:Uncharacterized protein n=1 Tax=Medicago truncatula TaxID=3880 RepID=A0A396JX87_MEDTR|nr:hypothetical protein MtrunA17_Chr1g0204311 [Medicago truncatula]